MFYLKTSIRCIANCCSFVSASQRTLFAGFSRICVNSSSVVLLTQLPTENKRSLTSRSRESAMCSPTMAAPVKQTYNEARLIAAKVSKRSGKRDCLKSGRNENDAPIRTVLCDKTSDHACIQRPPVCTADDIRLRFLNRLGFQQLAPPSFPRGQKVPPSHRNISTEPLKDTAATDDSSADATESSTSCLSSSSSSLRSKSRSVSFDDSVTVRPIPRHDAYPSNIKHLIWADPHEIYENATRNSIEFAAENFDWQQAAEEEDMIMAENGELVHPIHYLRQCNMQRNFLLVMAARQHAQQCK